MKKHLLIASIIIIAASSLNARMIEFNKFSKLSYDYQPYRFSDTLNFDANIQSLAWHYQAAPKFDAFLRYGFSNDASLDNSLTIRGLFESATANTLKTTLVGTGFRFFLNKENHKSIFIELGLDYVTMSGVETSNSLSMTGLSSSLGIGHSFKISETMRIIAKYAIHSTSLHTAKVGSQTGSLLETLSASGSLFSIGVQRHFKGWSLKNLM